MKERPILFSAPMVRAILDGTKTQTRRLVKQQPKNDRVGMVNAAYCGFPQTWLVDGAVSEYTCNDEPAPQWVCPYGKPGDHLWVRETFMGWYNAADGSISNAAAYRADGYKLEHGEKWQPSIHMPRAASRITLEITGVRVERLQDISEADAIDEGSISVRNPKWDMEHFPEWRKEFDAACNKSLKPPLGPSPKMTFQALWQSINGAGAWEANPWVWVVEFKRLEGGAV